MPAVRGDFAALKTLRERIAKLATAKATEDITKRVGAAFIKQLADEFRQSRDPYGKPWAPVFRNRKRDRAARGRRLAAGKPARAAKPLSDTGRLRAAATASSALQSSGSIVRITIPVSYASYHQDGTRHIKRRQMLPAADTGGLGRLWTTALRKEASAAILEAAGKKKGGGG